MIKRFPAVRWFIYLGVCLTFGLAYGHPAQLQGQRGAVWSPPEFVGDGWWQSIAVDRLSTAHIAWYGITNNRDALHYRAYREDGTHTDVNDIFYFGFAGFTVRNALAATSDGNLGAIFREESRHFFSKAYSTIAENAVNWTEPVQLSEFAYYADLTIDRDDVWHVLYGEGLGDTTQEGINPEFEECFQCSEVLYKRSSDGGQTWSSPINLSNTPGGSDKMEIWQGNSGRMYVRWDEGYDGSKSRGAPLDVRFTYSDDGGMTWADPVIFKGEEQKGYPTVQLALTELDNDTLLAVWRYSIMDRGVYYQISTNVGATWSDPELIPGIYARDILDTPFDGYELITDQQGIGHLFLAGTLDPAQLNFGGIYRLEFRQRQWRPPEVIYQNPAQIRAEWPKVALGPKNDIHLTWFIRDFRGNRRQEAAALAVYYSYRTSNLLNPPEVAFNATATQVPTTVVIQEFEATLTPFPTTTPLSETNTATTSDLYAIQTLLASVFVSVLFCGGVLVLLGFRPRH